ncbi:MAG: hypothetical protein QOC68_4655, partial [Solirubrobacteraceae bacterium]|nr:hypothetical protein [Solirubrobacteraceae bacterium]
MNASPSAVHAADHSAAVRNDGADCPRPTALRSKSSSAETATDIEKTSTLSPQFQADCASQP